MTAKNEIVSLKMKETAGNTETKQTHKQRKVNKALENHGSSQNWCPVHP